MASSAPASTGHVDPADRLRRARNAVTAGLTDPTTGMPRPVLSATPIRTLPNAVAAVVAARAAAGLAPVGEFFPRQPLLRRVGVPTLGLAGVALLAAVLALLTDRDVVAGGALVAFLLLTVAGGTTVRWAHADPLRIDPQTRFVVAAASRWRPARAADVSGPAQALVATAATAAQRIVDSPAWRGGTLAHGGVAIALASELDLIEQRAARSREEDWARLVTRVSALVAYADTVTTLDVAAGAPDAADVEMLAFLLSAAIYNSS